MKRHWLAWASIAGLLLVGAAQAQDKIKTESSTLSGRILDMDAVKVDLIQGLIGGGKSREVPVNQIQVIYYDGEPIDLRTAKGHVLVGRYAEALAALDRIKEEPSRPEIRQDIEFYKALCAAKLALGGSMKITDAGRMMKAFADENTKNYHYFEASEAVGDLLVAIRQYAQAADYYGRLQKAPWPDYQMRAGVAVGRALLAEGKPNEALAAFDKVIGVEAKGDSAQRQRMAASLGKAGVLVAQHKPDEAIKLVEAVLKQADAEDVPLMARAYNVLGTAHRQAGRAKEALLAFLHVDVLYSAEPDAHAEALANLADLWEQAHKTERANRARETLEERYKDGPWAKKGG